MNKKYVTNYGDDSIGKYFKEMRKSDLLTIEEEVSLAKRIKDEGDEKAVEILVESNLRFVVAVAKEYQNQGLPLADLINEGNLGLIKAAKKFDYTRGFRFISYAVWWVRQAILHSLNVDSRTIRLPANVISQLSKVNKELLKFESKHEREGNIGDILNEEGEEIILFSTPKVKSLNVHVNEEGSELYELLEDKSEDEDDSYIIDKKLKEELENTLSILSERERDIIKSYFGVNREHNGMTLDDIGIRYSLTKERIRQIKEKAIRKLRHNSSNLFDLIH